MEEIKQENNVTQDYYQDENLKIIEELKLQQQKELADRDAKYSTLLKAYANGERATTVEEAPLTPQQKEEMFNNNCKALMSDHLSNLEMAKKLLEVRQYELDLHNKDIFCGDDVNPSEGTINKSKQVADYIQYAIDNCDGDNEVFSNILGSHLVEVLR